MRSHEFLAAVREQVVPSLPAGLGGLRSRVAYGMLQLYFADPRIHYEVWLVRKTGRIEIGLHFEADRDTNQAAATELAGLVFEIQEALGPEADLEDWTSSWTRLHLTLPLVQLDDELSHEVAGKLAILVRLTGDRIAAIPGRRQQWQTELRAEPSRHWHHRGRRPTAPL